MTYDFDSKVICIIFSSCEYFEGDHELEIRYNLETKEMKALKIQKVPYFGNYNPNVEYNLEAVLKVEKTFLSNQADIKCLADHKEMIENGLSKIKHFSEKYGETKKQAEVKLKSIIESIKINYYNLDTLFEYLPKNNELYPKINFVNNTDDAIPNEEESLFSPTIVEFCLGCEHHRKVILNNIFVEISTLPIEVQEIICSHYNNSNKPSVKKSVKNNRKRNPFDRKPHYRALP